jgi:hypothetical protein
LSDELDRGDAARALVDPCTAPDIATPAGAPIASFTIRGVVDDQPAAATFGGGRLRVDNDELLARARVIVSMGDTFHTSSPESGIEIRSSLDPHRPLAVMLTLLRAFSSIDEFEMSHADQPGPSER